MMYQIFKEAALQYPSANALINSEGQRWTYRELDQTVQQWASYFHTLGVRSHDRVAVRLDNEDAHVIAFLALSYLNAAYVPFDYEVSEKKFHDDLKRLGVKRYFSDDDFSTEVLSQLEQYSPRLNNDSVDTDVSYWVSSSGTTGEKKWIPILGAGLNYWAKQLRVMLSLEVDEKVLATRSPAYDARIFEYLKAFSSGATLCLLNRNERKDFQAVLNVCKQQKIASLLFIASQFQSTDLNKLIEQFKLSGMKHLLVTGDVCTPHLKYVCEQHEIFLWNCYGPTEATFGYSMVCVNGLSLWSDDRQPIVPIGKAWGEEVRHHIIDEKLYIESPYLTPGYLNAEEDSHYFIEMSTEEGGVRLFDTQDRFIEQNGYLYFQGRWNYESHCKVNGVKVTPHFIEACINDYYRYNPLVQIQAVVVIKDYLNQPKPFAYVVVPENFDLLAFHQYLKTHLEAEEWPIIIPLDTLPRMQTSDKIDRQLLIHRHDDVNAWWFDAHSSEEPSASSCLEQVRKIWKHVLQRHTIPDDAEFIFLGGTSLEAMQLAHQIQSTIDAAFTYQDLLQLNQITVEAITQRLQTKVALECHLPERALIQPLLNDACTENKTPLFFLPALLGEGYFSYYELAKSMSHHLSQPMYGLSDPGILDDKLLPRDMSHAVQRYIAAIKTVQPSGPYQLLGFSFGSTLAYEVAKGFIAQGDVVKKLHLIDSFPPMIYQALGEQDKTTLLQALMCFLLPIFNNKFYGEDLNASHMESGFTRLKAQLKNPQSHRLLHIAKRHLEWMESLPVPSEPLALSPVIYFTKQEQAYLNIINQVGLSKLSSDYRFYGWNRYFTDVRRSAIELSCDHLGALKAENHPQQYWQRAHDAMFNLDFDYYGPKTNYRWQQGAVQQTLSVFFLRPNQARRLVERLQSLNLAPEVYFHDKQIEKCQQKDRLFYQVATLTCTVPHTIQETVARMLDEAGYEPLPVIGASRCLISQHVQREVKHQAIDLHLIYGSVIYMTLTFYIDVAPNIVIQALHQQLAYPKKPEVIEQHVIYFLRLACVEMFKALDGARQDIANFVTVIKPALESSSKYSESYPKRSDFFQPPTLSRLCKKYKLPDQGKRSLEKGLRNAANNHQLADIKFFLQSDIDINAADEKQSRTALYWAIAKGWDDCAEYLKAHGARNT
ncbi:MAG: AMP-binding protein [Legionellaceae bacterium]|nr:AMP-binding protein [Legionellaceae bacterium]